jgi:glyoxylase-like metal-dependent hydrolase (beta-lactamase superfamily II)
LDRTEFYIEKIFPFLALIRIPYLFLGGTTTFVNIFLIIDKELTLIDTGPWRECYGDEFSSCLAKFGFSIKDISKIIYTHPHPDHMGGGVKLRREGESSHLIYWKAREHVEQYGEYVKFMKSLAEEAFRKHLEKYPEKNECHSRVLDKFWHPTFGEVEIDHVLHDGEIIDCGRLRLEVIFNPGHSPWDLSLWEEKKGLLFSGDFLMQKMTSLTGGLNGFGSSLDDYQLSLKKLEHYVKKARYVLPSHGAPIKDGSKLIEDILGIIKWREDKIIEKLFADKCSLLDLEAVFSSNNDPLIFVRHLGVLLSHLERLVKHEKIVQLEQDNGEILFMLKK